MRPLHTRLGPRCQREATIAENGATPAGRNLQAEPSTLPLKAHFGALLLWYIHERRALAQLQGTNIADDRPAVGRRHLGGVARHRPEAVGDHVEEMAHRHLAQPIAMERGRTAKSTAADHPIAVGQAPMAWRAVDVVALLTALQDLKRDREWERVGRTPTGLPGREMLIG